MRAFLMPPSPIARVITHALSRDGEGPREAAMADNDTTTEQPTDIKPEGDVEPTTGDNSATEDPQGDDNKLGTAGKSALERERRDRREAERARCDAERARRDLEKQLKEFQDKEKTEAEKAASRAADAEKRVTDLVKRAVRSEVKAQARDFEDPEDAVAFLDLSSYSDEDGEINVEQIKADLADLLERKPHLAKKAPQGEPERRRPAPDRTQASSANAPRSASPEDVFAGFVKSRLNKGR